MYQKLLSPKRMAEAVVERGAERFVATLILIGVLDSLFAASDGINEGGNSILPAKPCSYCLPDENAEREWIAGAVVEQRLPVGDFGSLEISLFAQFEGEPGGVGVPHAGHLDEMGNLAEPLLFVPSRGEQNLDLACGVELELFQKVAEIVLLVGGRLRIRAFRAAGHRFDIVRNPTDGN